MSPIILLQPRGNRGTVYGSESWVIPFTKSSIPYVRVSDPGAPGKLDRLKFLLEKSVI